MLLSGLVLIVFKPSLPTPVATITANSPFVDPAITFSAVDCNLVYGISFPLLFLPAKLICETRVLSTAVPLGA